MHSNLIGWSTSVTSVWVFWELHHLNRAVSYLSPLTNDGLGGLSIVVSYDSSWSFSDSWILWSLSPMFGSNSPWISAIVVHLGSEALFAFFFLIGLSFQGCLIQGWCLLPMFDHYNNGLQLWDHIFQKNPLPWLSGHFRREKMYVFNPSG